MAKVSRKREVKYSAEQAFGVIMDIEKYPEFLENYKKNTIIDRLPSNIVADTTMIGGMKEYHFKSYIKFREPHDSEAGFVKVSAFDGPFKSLNITWTIAPTASKSCMIAIDGDFQFKSLFTQCASKLLITSEDMDRTIRSFERRLQEIYK